MRSERHAITEQFRLAAGQVEGASVSQSGSQSAAEPRLDLRHLADVDDGVATHPEKEPCREAALFEKVERTRNEGTAVTQMDACIGAAGLDGLYGFDRHKVCLVAVTKEHALILGERLYEGAVGGDSSVLLGVRPGSVGRAGIDDEALAAGRGAFHHLLISSLWSDVDPTVARVFQEGPPPGGRG